MNYPLWFCTKDKIAVKIPSKYPSKYLNANIYDKEHVVRGV